MADPANKVTLWVGGQVHEGWTDTAINLNLDHMAGDFRLTLTEEYLADGQLQRMPVKAGAACRLGIDGNTVLTGWVDSHNPGYTATSHSVTISGRDKTGDLVDCSTQVKEYLNQKLEVIASDMCAPFDITVLVDCDTGQPFKRVAVNTGDTVQSCIERMCRQRGVLAWSDGLGNLIIGRGTMGKPVATLVRGKNVLAASANDNFTGRFSEIIVRGPRETPDSSDPTAGSQEQGVATDGAVGRHRPKIMVPETQGAIINLNERAAHEQRVAQGKSRVVSATVPGWYHENGLWRPRQTVAFTDDWLGISGNFLVGNVALSKDGDSGGTVTTLNLYPPGAFDRLAEAGDD